MADTLTQTPNASVPAAIEGLPSAPDLDQLLDDAESLAREIAEAVTLDDVPSQPEAGQPVEPPTALRADVEAESTAPPAIPPVSPDPESVAPQLPPQPTPASDQIEQVAATETETALPEQAVVEEQPAKIATPSAVADTPPLEEAIANDAHAATIQAEPESTGNTPVIEPQRKSLAARIVGVVLWTMWLPARLIFTCLAILDLPFSGLSLAAKQKIGIVGIATLIMAAAAYYLPGMMQSNPYIHITDFPPAAVEDGHGGEGGGEHSKPPAADQAKPESKSSAGHH